MQPWPMHAGLPGCRAALHARAGMHTHMHHNPAPSLTSRPTSASSRRARAIISASSRRPGCVGVASPPARSRAADSESSYRACADPSHAPAHNQGNNQGTRQTRQLPKSFSGDDMLYTVSDFGSGVGFARGPAHSFCAWCLLCIGPSRSMIVPIPGWCALGHEQPPCSACPAPVAQEASASCCSYCRRRRFSGYHCRCRCRCCRSQHSTAPIFPLLSVRSRLMARHHLLLLHRRPRATAGRRPLPAPAGPSPASCCTGSVCTRPLLRPPHEGGCGRPQA